MAVSTYADILRRRRGAGTGFVAGNGPATGNVIYNGKTSTVPAPGPVAPLPVANAPVATGPVESALDRARRIASGRTGGTAADSILAGAGRGGIRSPNTPAPRDPGIDAIVAQSQAAKAGYGGAGAAGGELTGTIGGMSAADLMKRIDEEQAAAKAANESRYNEGYQKLSDLYTRGMAGLTGQGEQARKDIGTQYANAVAEGQQGLASRGLGNSTLLGNVQLGAARDSAASTARLNESLAQQRLAADTQLTGGLTDWIQARTDEYPNTGLYSDLLMQLAQSGGEGSSSSSANSMAQQLAKFKQLLSGGQSSTAMGTVKKKKSTGYKLGDYGKAQQRRTGKSVAPRNSVNRSTKSAISPTILSMDAAQRRKATTRAASTVSGSKSAYGIPIHF